MRDRLIHTWNAGERYLAEGEYMFARRALETAEAMAWRRRDAAALARLYLPLLEACRQLRHQACAGHIIISPVLPSPARAHLLRADAGTFVGSGPEALVCGRHLIMAARNAGASVEFLLLLRHGTVARLCSPGAATFAAGLTVRWTTKATALAEWQAAGDPLVPLPRTGDIAPDRPEHALAAEALLAAWEALALRWRQRHGTTTAPWEEMALLRRTRQIDPACEPVFMRLIALAEAANH